MEFFSQKCFLGPIRSEHEQSNPKAFLFYTGGSQNALWTFHTNPIQILHSFSHPFPYCHCTVCFLTCISSNKWSAQDFCPISSDKVFPMVLIQCKILTLLTTVLPFLCREKNTCRTKAVFCQFVSPRHVLNTFHQIRTSSPRALITGYTSVKWILGFCR